KAEGESDVKRRGRIGVPADRQGLTARRSPLARPARRAYHPHMATAPPAARPGVYNLPNLLTATRLGLAVVLFACIAYDLWLAGLVVFAVAAVTDWLDGYLARKLGVAGAFGRQFDPLVDKVLICGAFIF